MDRRFCSRNLIDSRIYTRNQLAAIFGITDSTIRNGIFKPKKYSSVLLFVTEEKASDRTPYEDSLIGDDLKMDGQTFGRTDHLLINHVRDGNEILLFHRKSNKEFPEFGFRYEGKFAYSGQEGSRPTRFHLVRSRNGDSKSFADIEAFKAEEEFFEGGAKAKHTNFYERNPRLRDEAIRLHGTVCLACGFDFQSVYGEHGTGFIEVHHLTPISSLREEHLVNPRTDLIPLCSNCHRMTHRNPAKVLSLEELRGLLGK